MAFTGLKKQVPIQKVEQKIETTSRNHYKKQVFEILRKKQIDRELAIEITNLIDDIYKQ